MARIGAPLPALGIALLAGTLALSPGVAAAPKAQVAAGERIATAGSGAAAACAGCHGVRGEGAGAFPRLAGTGAAYLREQLKAFAAGQRRNPIMQPIAQALSAEQRGEVAAFYASLPQPVRAEDVEPKKAEDVGAWLATRGRWSEDVPACAQCHGPGGIGVGASFPPLAGQPAAYLERQLKAWRTGDRPPGPLGLMQIVARKLSDSDSKAVSDYYAQLPSRQPAAPVSAGARSGQ